MAAVGLTVFPAAPAAQIGKSKIPEREAAKAAKLTDEEIQILKERELLENLDLLMSFEAVRYLQFLVEPRVDNSDARAAAGTKRGSNAKKKKGR